MERPQADFLSLDAESKEKLRTQLADLDITQPTSFTEVATVVGVLQVGSVLIPGGIEETKV